MLFLRYLLMTAGIGMINLRNRMGVGFRSEPKERKQSNPVAA